MLQHSHCELPDQGDNIIRTKELDITPNPDGLGYDLYLHMKKFSKNLAQIDLETEQSETYSTLLQRCIRVALYLRRRGITPEDIISPISHMHMETTVIFVAPLLIGCRVACMDPFASLMDLKVQIEVIKPKLIFVIEESEEKIDKLKEELKLDTEIVVLGETSKNTPFKDLIKPLLVEEEENFEPMKAKDLFDTALIAFSSGTSAISKGICINHYSILCQTQRFSVTRNTAKSLMYTNLAWVSAQLTIIAKTFAGGVNSICWPFDPATTWKYLVKYDINSLALSLKHYVELMRYGNPERLETPNLQAVLIGGGKINLENMNTLRKLFTRPILILNPYGQSEIFGPILMPGRMDLQMKKPESAGCPIPGIWYKIVDLDTEKTLGPNQRGELRIKSKFIMNGYYNVESTESFDSDGFLKTGDVAYYDEDHFFYIVDRCGQMYKYKSEWISPVYLESILYQHPDVKVACVVGVHSDFGTLATAVVVKSNSGKNVTEDELLEFVNNQVDDDIKKLRGGIIFVDEDFISFTPSDKVRRYDIKKKVQELLNKN